MGVPALRHGHGRIRPGEDSPRRQAGSTCGGFGWTDLAVSGESLARGFLSSPIVSGENNCRTSRSCSSMMLLLIPSPGASRDAQPRCCASLHGARGGVPVPLQSVPLLWTNPLSPEATTTLVDVPNMNPYTGQQGTLKPHLRDSPGLERPGQQLRPWRHAAARTIALLTSLGGFHQRGDAGQFSCDWKFVK